MKVHLNDYGAYAFPFELSVALAKAGHQVLHTYCDSLDATPNGCFVDQSECPDSLTLQPLRLKETLHKESLLKRQRQDVEYGRLVSAAMDQFCPDVVISGNTPLDAQRQLKKRCHQQNAAFIFWLQDVLSHAIGFGLRRRLGPAAIPLTGVYRRREGNLMRSSDHVVSITSDFEPLLRGFRVPANRQTVIENWAPLDQFPIVNRENRWSESREFGDRFTFVYSGTLSLKHNPRLLAELAKRVAAEGGVVVLRSTGKGAEYLKQVAIDESIGNLFIEGFGPFAETPLVFGSADVLIALLEPDASHFSVPSKVLSYLCAGRPLLLAVPKQNLASNIVRNNEAGFVCDPDDADGFLASAEVLMKDQALRHRMGRNARAYAEATFDISKIAGNFTEVFDKAIALRSSPA